MHFEPGEIYHVFNRGNEKQTVFFERAHYLHFLKKVCKEWKPYCRLFSYCLMPNHFHFLIQVNEQACRYVLVKDKETHLQSLSRAIGNTLSSYTKTINKRYGRVGCLFQKKTKAKSVLLETGGFSKKQYLMNCIIYIHENPVYAKFCKGPTDWEFSSAAEYAGLSLNRICDKEKFLQESGMSPLDFSARQATNSRLTSMPPHLSTLRL